MRKLNMSSLSQILMATVLGISVTACSSPEQDAEVREEPTASADVQEQEEVQVNAIEGERSNVPKEADDPALEGYETQDMDDIEATESGSIDGDDTQVDALDDDEVLDGTEQEEHLSTY